jgi:hypothetical protein
VDKTIQYEKNPEIGGAWYSIATGIASNQGPGDDNEYDYQHENVIWNDKLDPFTFENFNPIYDPGANASLVSNAVNTGTSLINYTGHGSQISWGTSNFNNSNVAGLTNGNKLPWIVSVACNNGEFHTGECFAESWTKKQGGGAVLMLASTISQPWDPPMRGQDYFADVLIGGYDYSAHPGQNGINTTEQRTTAGAIIFNGLTLMLTESGGASDLETAKTWTIFGDPALQVRTAPPAELTLSNEIIMVGVPFNTTVSAGVPVEGAMVTLSQDDQYFSAITDASGAVSIPHTLLPGIAKLVVSGFNTGTIYEDVDVIAATGPWVMVNDFTVNDLSGNANGQADFGENILLNVNAQNIGSGTALGVWGTLSSPDSFVTVIQNYHTYGNMAANSTIAGDSAFAVSIANNIPDGYYVPFQVQFAARGGLSWSSDFNMLVNAPEFDILGLTVIDTAAGCNNNGILDPGETADILISTLNCGHADAPSPVANLATASSYLILNSVCVNCDTVAAGETAQAVYSVTAADSIPFGTPADLEFSITSGAYSAAKTIPLRIGELAQFVMSNNTVTVDYGIFFDSGGENGAYQNYESYTMTFLPEQTGSLVKLNFTAFSVEDGWDFLYIYDGESITAPQVPGSPFTGQNSPGEIIAGNPAGALTARFTSDGMVTADGWIAEISPFMLTGINDENGSRMTFDLHQNYPNPFNPSTTIHYQLPKAVDVKLTVYNILGQKISTLVDQHQQPGSYQAVWQGLNDAGQPVASGIYFYTIEAGSFSKKHKMILIG